MKHLILPLLCATMLHTHAAHAAPDVPCHTIKASDRSSMPETEHFAPPWNNTPINGTLIRASCNEDISGFNLQAGEAGNENLWVYERGHVYRDGGWSPIHYDCAVSKHGDWCRESAFSNGHSSDSNLLGTMPTYTVAYICLWENETWKCGCKDLESGSYGCINTVNDPTSDVSPGWNIQRVDEELAVNPCDGNSDDKCSLIDGFLRSESYLGISEEEAPTPILYRYLDEANLDSNLSAVRNEDALRGYQKLISQGYIIAQSYLNSDISDTPQTHSMKNGITEAALTLEEAASIADKADTLLSIATGLLLGPSSAHGLGLSQVSIVLKVLSIGLQLPETVGNMLGEPAFETGVFGVYLQRRIESVSHDSAWSAAIDVAQVLYIGVFEPSNDVSLGIKYISETYGDATTMEEVFKHRYAAYIASLESNRTVFKALVLEDIKDSNR